MCVLVKIHLALYDQNRLLEERVRKPTEELAYAQDVTIIGFAALAEFLDHETGAHIFRTSYIGCHGKQTVNRLP